MRALPDGRKASVWICVVVVVVAATMMHPTGASLLAIALIAGLLGLLRWVAHREGQAMGSGGQHQVRTDA